eukprot:gene1493-1734_t
MWSYRGAKFLFKKFFGHYFQYELEKDQFDIGFKKGTINISNLELNIKRVNQDLSGLPLSLASGYIGNIFAKVPYTSLWDSPSVFDIKDLELSFVSNENYESLVLQKLSDLEYQQANSSSINSDDYVQQLGIENQYYSDEDEEIDSQNHNHQSHFGFEGLEALTEIIKKLVDKVSAKVVNCNISITHYDKKQNKSIVLLFLIDSIEYLNDQTHQTTNNSNANNNNTSSPSSEDKTSFFYKNIQLNNFSIKVAEKDGNLLNTDIFYTNSIFNSIPLTSFQTIFTNKKENTSSSTSSTATTTPSSSASSTPLDSPIDYIHLKIKRNERLTSVPLLNIECNFRDWTVLISPTQLDLIQHGGADNQKTKFSIQFKWSRLRVFLFDRQLCNINEFLQQHFQHLPYKTNFFLLHLQDLFLQIHHTTHTKQFTLNIAHFNFFQHIAHCPQSKFESTEHDLNNMIHPNKTYQEKNSIYDVSAKITFIYQNEKSSYDRDINLQLKDVSFYFYPYLLVSVEALLRDIKGHREVSDLKEVRKFDNSSPIIRSSNSYEDILTDLKNASFKLDNEEDNTLTNDDEGESTCTQLHIHSSLIKVNIKFPDHQLNDNHTYLHHLRSEIVSLYISNVKIVSNIIKDMKDVKWLIDFDDLHTNLVNEMNDSVRFFEIQTQKDVSNQGIIPLEITVRGNVAAYSNYDIDLNSPPLQGRSCHSHFNPFKAKEKHKGPFSSFVSTSEGIFDNSWLDEAEQDELSSFRHSSIESSKYVFNIIIPHLKVEIKKDELNLLVNLFESLSGFIDKHHKVDETAKVSKDDSPSSLKRGKNLSLLSVFLVVNRGVVILSENDNPSSLSSSSNSVSSSSTAKPNNYYKYTIEFDRFEIFNVSQYFGRDISFINASFSQLDLKEQDFSIKGSKARSIISQTLHQTNKLTANQGLSATLSINNDKTDFLDQMMEGKLLSLVFKGATIEHSVNSVWYTRLQEFFNFSPAPSTSTIPEIKVPNKEATDQQTMTTFINFVDCSLCFTPSSSLTSSAVFLFNDTKWKITNSKKISCNGQNTHILTIDDVQSLKDLSASTHSSVLNYWKSIGYEPSAHLDYFEFEIIKQDSLPTFSLNFNHNNLSISACSDSFYVLNEVISNMFGLDIPYAEVADLIITQGITPDLKENIDILVNEDSFRGTPFAPPPESATTTASSFPPSSNPSPLINSFSNTPNLEFEDFEDDPSSFNDLSDDDEGTFYEYHSPVDMVSTASKMSDSTSSMDDANDIINQDTSSQTSNAPIMGSVMIEDYDHEKLESFQSNQHTMVNEYVSDDQLNFYVDFDQLGDFKQDLTPPSPPFRYRPEGSAVWLDPRGIKSIEPIENYISSPGEDPEDCDLPPIYPKSVTRILFRKMNISLKIYKGNDFETKDQQGKALSPTSSKLRDTNSFVEFILSDFNLRIDKFEESEKYSKRLSLQIRDVTRQRETLASGSPASAKKKMSHATSRSIPEDKAHTTDKEAQEITYFQTCEILPVRLKVDYKPKKLDYHSLTSGNYAQLLNLLPLEGAIFNLNRLKLNGVGGWGALFNQIGKLWIPHIIHTQLLGYISGVRGINSLVHVGESLANLVVLPLEQYKKDGKVLKGLRKGTTTFLKNLTLETLSVGAKMAVGTQGLLETADSALSSNGSSPSSKTKYIQTSKFSGQPVDTKEGIQHAYESVSREIRSAAHTIIAIPMKEYQQKGTKGYMKSMVKAVPIAIIRPMIGITEGVSKTLLGVRNQIDPLKKTESVYKYK